MPRFLVERYLPDLLASEVDELVNRIASLAPDMHAAGATHIRTVLVPCDELCLCEFEAVDVSVVHRANTAAGLPVDRVVAAVECS